MKTLTRWALTLALAASAMVFATAGMAAAACSVTTGDFDGNGTDDVQILGDPRGQTLTIVDDPMGGSTTITLDCNGDGDLSDAHDVNTVFGEFETFDIRLGDGDDSVTFSAVSRYSGKRRSLLVRLDPGANQFTFDLSTATAKLQDGSVMTIDVRGGDGADAVDLHFDRIDSGSLALVHADLAGGHDTATLTFDKEIDTASVDVDLKLGGGNNTATVNLTGGIGHLNDAPANVRIAITGGDDPAKVDTVTLAVGGDIGAEEFSKPSRLLVDVSLRDGNDVLTLNVDLDSFNVHGAGSAQFHIDGGGGADVLTLTRGGTTGPATLDGLLDIVLHGGGGADALTVDLGGPGALTTASTSGTLRLRVDGDAGPDTGTVNLSADASSTVKYDLVIRGGSGDDTLSFTMVNLGDNTAASYLPTGFALSDGGFGAADQCSIFGNPLTQTRNCE